MPRIPPPPPESIPVDIAYMKARRRELGFTQMKVAELAQLSSGQYYSSIERGTHVGIHVDTLRRVAWALNCPIERLVIPIDLTKPKLDTSKPLATSFQWPPVDNKN